MSFSPMDYIRDRASAFQMGQINDWEYIQEIVNFIVLNKEQLPENVSHSLHQAFGRGSGRGAGTCRSRNDALKRVSCLKREDIRVPEYLNDAIILYKSHASLFWTGEQSSSSQQAFSNVLSDLYYANRRRTATNSVRRAFYCVALYRVIQQIMSFHSCKTFTSNISRFCADMILSDPAPDKPQSRDDVINQLKSDYKIGGVYEPYARKEGCGIFFYLFVLPSEIYEKYLNKDDVNTVLCHYKSTGFRQESSIQSASANIMGFISERLNSQMILFKMATDIARPLKLPATRKRNTKLVTGQPSKKMKGARQDQAPRQTNAPPFEPAQEFPPPETIPGSSGLQIGMNDLEFSGPQLDITYVNSIGPQMSVEYLNSFDMQLDIEGHHCTDGQP